MQSASKYSTYEIRLRAIEALKHGMSVTAVASAYQTHRATIYRWWNRYLKGKDKGLERKSGSGRPRCFVQLDAKKFTNLVLSSALSFGYESDLWTCSRIQETIKTEFQLQLSRCTIWRRLREAKLTYQKPERRYIETSEKERRKWRRYELPKIRRCMDKNRAILYFQDESNIKLGALLGKTWAPKGKTPPCKVTGKREGVSAMSSISSGGGLIFKLHTKKITSEEVIDFLRQMLNHHPKRHLVVVMDQAPPHTSKKTQRFVDSQKRLHIFFLPKYSPDWNPDEKVWNHLNHQELKSHQAKTKEALRDLAEEKLTKLSNSPEILRGIFFRCFVADLLK